VIDDYENHEEGDWLPMPGTAAMQTVQLTMCGVVTDLSELQSSTGASDPDPEVYTEFGKLVKAIEAVKGW